jgi:hypothetical protein
MKNLLALILGLPAGLGTGMLLAYLIPGWLGRTEAQLIVGVLVGTIIGGLVGAISGGELNAQESGVARIVCGALTGAIGGVIGASDFKILSQLPFRF